MKEQPHSSLLGLNAAPQDFLELKEEVLALAPQAFSLDPSARGEVGLCVGTLFLKGTESNNPKPNDRSRRMREKMFSPKMKIQISVLVRAAAPFA